MPDSSVATVYIPAYTGNYTKNRVAQGVSKPTEITVHHCAGIMTIESLGNLWQKVGRLGSSHYGVRDNTCAQYVLEKDVAWTNSLWAANCRAVTIETSNSGGAPDWKVSDASIDTLVKLVADIANRNDIYPLVVGKNLTYHSMYHATACPGPYLFARLQTIADRANALVKSYREKPALGGVKPIINPSLVEGQAIVTVGPASAGDVNTMRSLATVLGLGFVNNNGTMEIGPMSKGDQLSVVNRAIELSLPYVVEAYPREKYSVLVEGFTSKEKADTFSADCVKQNLTATIKKV